MKITPEKAIEALCLRITRTQPKRVQEETLCLLYANGEHFFIATRAGEADAYARIPFDKRDFVQASFTSAHLPCGYYFGEEQ